MSHFLQRVLGRDDYHFATDLRELEKTTGERGIDTAIIGDMMSRAHRVMRALGLDTTDTTALELYKALAVHAEHTQLFSDTDFVALVVDGEVISFNQTDIRTNIERPFALRTFDALRGALASEIITRYEVVPSRRVSLLIEQSGLRTSAKAHTTTRSTTPDKSTVLVAGDTGVASTMTVPDDGDGDSDLTLQSGTTVVYSDADVTYGAGSAGVVASRLAKSGATTQLATWVGDDSAGKATLAALTKCGVNVASATTVRGASTQRYVTLAYRVGATTFIHASDIDYRWVAPAKSPDWLVVAAMHKQSWTYLEDVLRYIADAASTRVVFYPGYEQLGWGRTKLRRAFRAAALTIVSIEDARQLLKRSTADISEITVALRNYNVRHVVVMDRAAATVSVSHGRGIVQAEYHDTDCAAAHGRECYDEYVASFIDAYIRSEDDYQALEAATFDCTHRKFAGSSDERVTIKELRYL